MKTTDQDSIGTVGSGDRTDQQPAADSLDMAAPTAEDSAEILTLVCFKCGTEYYFSDGSQPQEMTCEKCGNTVFREFDTPAADDEAAASAAEEQARSMAYGDASPDTAPGEVMDLDQGPR